MSKIYDLTTNPNQYDFINVNWTKETFDAPIRKFFFDYLKRYRERWKNKTILEIGFGTGWLLNLLNDYTSKAEGIESSDKNIEFVKNEFPNLKVFQTTLEKFNTDKKYDLVIAVMVFSHIKNVEFAFRKIAKFMEKNAELQIIVPDYNYYRRHRFGYKIDYEKLSEEEYCVAITRDDGTIADVVRTTNFYQQKASKVGLLLVEAVPMTPNKKLIKLIPKYEIFKRTALTQLMRFRKT